jgi:two-component system, LuxR family, response regulator FixJ
LRYINAIAGRSCFFISFRSRWQNNESNSVMTQLRAAVNAKHVILVVDDDAAVRNSLKFMMEVEGFEVRAYANANELLKEGTLPVSSCLVVDYHMPAMNGLGLVAVLRNRRISIPAILMTAHPDENIRKQAVAAGIPIVEKPLLGTRLLDSIREAFDGHAKSGSEASPKVS